MESRADYERKRPELNHRYATPEWMKDNVGWIIGAIAIALIIGAIHYVSGGPTRIVLSPAPETTGQGTRVTSDLAPPARLVVPR
jgi:hypothetical protein